jgi:galactose-1-phosphate uridylyltransferase
MTQKLIDLKGKQMRKLQMTQMYSRMFWEDKIKPVAEERWHVHLALHPELASKKGSALAFRNDVIKEFFEEESAEVKAEVARRRDEEVSDEETGANENDDPAGAASDNQRHQAKALSCQR